MFSQETRTAFRQSVPKGTAKRVNATLTCVGTIFVKSRLWFPSFQKADLYSRMNIGILIAEVTLKIWLLKCHYKR